MDKILKTFIFLCGITVVTGGTTFSMLPVQIPRERIEKLGKSLSDGTVSGFSYSSDRLQYFLENHQDELNNPITQEALFQDFFNHLICILSTNRTTFRDLAANIREYLAQNKMYYSPVVIQKLTDTIDRITGRTRATVRISCPQTC